MSLAGTSSDPSPDGWGVLRLSFTEVETGKTLSIEKSEDEDNLVLEGYTPFYISHYGRHGSRWMPHDDRYTWVNRHFEDVSNLTPLGKR